MKFLHARFPWAVVAVLVGAGAVRAHPGHEGHELTWEFSHLAQHPVATIGCAAVAGAAVALLAQVWRRRIEARTQSLRVEQRSRGK
jgi:hypothetical protein